MHFIIPHLPPHQTSCHARRMKKIAQSILISILLSCTHCTQTENGLVFGRPDYEKRNTPLPHLPHRVNARATLKLGP